MSAFTYSDTKSVLAYLEAHPDIPSHSHYQEAEHCRVLAESYEVDLKIFPRGSPCGRVQPEESKAKAKALRATEHLYRVHHARALDAERERANQREKEDAAASAAYLADPKRAQEQTYLDAKKSR